MATETLPFSPFWTQGKPGGSLILDRNLAAIKAALDAANATIIRQQTIINRTISETNISVTLPQPPSSPPAFDSAQDEPGTLSYPPGTNTLAARVWVSTPDPAVPYGVNMGGLGSGTLQQ